MSAEPNLTDTLHKMRTLVGKDMKGTEPPCPFCGRPRLKRSNYIRCGRCGVNWCDGEKLDRDPSIERKAKMLAGVINKK